MEIFSLEFFMYLVAGFAVVAYCMLDGFDLGVGALHLFAKDDKDRRIFLNAIGPVWDGNEVWLVIVGGVLLSAFTDAYATIFSAFYLPTMGLLACLIFRAVSIEFRSKRPSKNWRNTWDTVFSVASILIAIGVGVLLGNLVEGIPLDSEYNFTGVFLSFLTPYPIIVGITSLSLFTMHGSIFLLMKTEGDLHDRLRSWVKWSIVFFIIMYVILSVVTLGQKPYMLERMDRYPAFYFFPLGTLISILCILYFVRKGYDGFSFIFSCISIFFLFTLYLVGTFPYLVRSTVNTAENSVTYFNAASSHLTLKVLSIIVVIGVPLVLAYGYYIYRVFRGKVRVDEHSY